MSDQKNLTHTSCDRFLEIIPGLLVWLVLTSPIWLSLNLPWAMAFVIIFLDVYWLYRVVKTVVFSIIGYRRMNKAIHTDWLNKLRQDFPSQLNEIEQVIIIPSWKEHGYVIETTLAAIAHSEYPLNKVHVILALEARDEEEIKREKYSVASRYQNVFSDMIVTEHPDNLVGEVIGPGANRTWTLKYVLPQLMRKINIEQTIVTTLDADFAVHPRFLAGLTYKYLTTDKPEHKSFTGIFIYSNNYWQAPAPMRIISASLAVGQMAELVESWKYIIFSSHSFNLKTLIELGFWTTDHVNDDSHLYWKAFYRYGSEYQVVPHWLPIYADTVLDENLKKTFINQYKQLQRWAYGAEHIPFVIKQAVNVNSIPILRRIERLLYVMRAFLFWATIAIITAFGALVVLAINQSFRQTVLGQNLTFYSSLILTIAVFGLFPMIYFSQKITPPMPKSWKLPQRIWGYAQVMISPMVLMTFGTIPAIDAQTRLMLGKYLTYRVTRKYRKPE